MPLNEIGARSVTKPSAQQEVQTLEAGTLVDYGLSTARPSEWTGGPLNASVWTGGVKNERRLEVTAFRCQDCGLLRLYADQDSKVHRWP